jgi:hypothetical protein
VKGTKIVKFMVLAPLGAGKKLPKILFSTTAHVEEKLNAW